MWQAIVSWAKRLKQDVAALFFATRESRTPLAAKLIAAFVVAYAVSPIDLIPDFIPVLGLLDDVILVPLGIALAVRLIPTELMAELRDRARAETLAIDVRWGIWIVIAIWVLAMGLCAVWFWPQ